MEDNAGEGLVAGRYRRVESLGKGSFGEVFKVEDLQFEPPRRVALKILTPQHTASETIRNDLKREAGVLARLDHPNILRVIDFSVSPLEAFIVTDLAAGGSLARKLRPQPDQPAVPFTLPAAADFLDHLADALDYAHSQGLIHRDLKPQNILLDRRGQPLIADFGLAAALDSHTFSSLVETNPSGTPPYMAPEQWQGLSGPASDLYALGVIVYYMLAGRTPFSGNLYQLCEKHLHAPLPKLSERAPGLVYPPALDDLLAQVMEKDPHRRLKPAGEFARRFRAVLAGTALAELAPDSEATLPTRPPRATVSSTLVRAPAAASPAGPSPAEPDTATRKAVPAEPHSVARQVVPAQTSGPIYAAPPAPIFSAATLPVAAREQSREQKKKKPALWPLLLAGLLALLLVAGVLAFVLLSRPPEAGSLAQASPTATGNSPASPAIVAAAPSPAVTSALARLTGQPVTPSEALTAPPARTAPPSPTGLAAPPFGSNLATLNGHLDLVLALAYSPDGKTLASASEDGTLKLWDSATFAEKASLRGHFGPVRTLAFSPDGLTLASGSADNTVRLWNTATGQEKGTLSGHTGVVTSVAFSPDGLTLASGSDDRTIRLWEAGQAGAASKPARVLAGHTGFVIALAFSPDGKTLASGSADNTIRLWDLETGKERAIMAGHSSWVWSLAYAPDGKTLASGSFDKTIKLWDAFTVKEKLTLSGPPAGFRQIAFSPDGRTLASACDDKTVRLWDVVNGKEKAAFSGHTAQVYGLAYAPDGQTIASGSADKTIKIWAVGG